VRPALRRNQSSPYDWTVEATERAEYYPSWDIFLSFVSRRCVSFDTFDELLSRLLGSVENAGRSRSKQKYLPHRYKGANNTQTAVSPLTHAGRVGSREPAQGLYENRGRAGVRLRPVIGWRLSLRCFQQTGPATDRELSQCAI
jgi:hypothetical protein